jgi:hypothetical protein
MKTSHFIIIAIFTILITISEPVYAQTARDILQGRDNAQSTKLLYNGSTLIINQTIPKLEYKMGENITIYPEMINIGSNPVTVSNGTPLFDIQIIYQNGTTVFDSGYSGLMIVGWSFTLNPGMAIHDNETWGWNPNAKAPSIKLNTPGKYTILTESNISLYHDAKEYLDHTSPHPEKSLWSEPIQITVLPTEYGKESTVTTDHVSKIISLDEIKKEIAAKYAHTDVWQNVVRLRSLSWSEDDKSIIIKTDNAFVGPNLWSLPLDGTKLHSIVLDDTIKKILQEKQDQSGNMTVFIPYSSSPVPRFGIMLGTLDKSYQEPLYVTDTSAKFPVISHDGKHVLFAFEAMSSWDKPEEDGLYVINLNTPIPEFPYATIVLITSIASLIIFYRVKFR